jgi:hypothetical protein
VEARKSQAKDSRQGAGSNPAQRAAHPSVPLYLTIAQRNSLSTVNEVIIVTDYHFARAWHNLVEATIYHLAYQALCVPLVALL